MIDRNQVKYESSVYSNKTKIQCVFRMNSDVDIIDAHFTFDSKELLSCLDDYTCTFVKIASHYQDIIIVKQTTLKFNNATSNAIRE